MRQVPFRNVSDGLQETCSQMGKKSPVHREVYQQDDKYSPKPTTSKSDSTNASLPICPPFPCTDSGQVEAPNLTRPLDLKPPNPQARPS